MSEWQMPQYLMSMTTSCSRGSRRSNEYGASGALAVGAAYPLGLLMNSRFQKNFREQCSSLDATPALAAAAKRLLTSAATEFLATRVTLVRTRIATLSMCARR